MRFNAARLYRYIYTLNKKMASLPSHPAKAEYYPRRLAEYYLSSLPTGAHHWQSGDGLVAAGGHNEATPHPIHGCTPAASYPWAFSSANRSSIIASVFLSHPCQGFIQQKQVRFLGQCPRQKHPLLLTAREFTDGPTTQGHHYRPAPGQWLPFVWRGHRENATSPTGSSAPSSPHSRR